MRDELIFKFMPAAVVAMAATLSICSLARAEPMVKDGDVLAIIGDSITEQKLYSVYIEDYLLMCQPTKVRAINFGWSGEQVVGLNARIADVLAFKPTLATTCYGMNDGHYVAINDDIRKTYREATKAMVKTLNSSGARIVLGSPGAVDTFSYKNRATSPDVYNANLAALTEEGRQVAKDNGLTFADVHSLMIEVMARAKLRYGNQFQVAGGDGIHPNADGHFIMAYTFLKALGFDGNIGEFDVDLAAHSAVATGGHKVLKIEGNAVTIESMRYPFCYTGKFGESNSTVAASEFLPFSDDLNRLTLKVTGPASNYSVTWGSSSKAYTAAQLKAGVNLAADFQNNPFSAPFAAVNRQVGEKQNAETALIKNLLHSLANATPYLPDQKAAVTNLIEAIKQRDEALAVETRNSVKPVVHTIIIEAVQ